ncbi:MAG: hypothetical protein HY652_09305 [Acidobacteria bacterium]|nr:hypothetical protein [Acidobacteriota bacterium]
MTKTFQEPNAMPCGSFSIAPVDRATLSAHIRKSFARWKVFVKSEEG